MTMIGVELALIRRDARPGQARRVSPLLQIETLEECSQSFSALYLNCAQLLGAWYAGA